MPKYNKCFSFTVKLFIGPGKVFNYFGDGTSTLPREIAPIKKLPLQKKSFKLFLFKNKNFNWRLIFVFVKLSKIVGK